MWRRSGQRTQLVVYFIDPEHQPLRAAPAVASFQPRIRKAAAIALKPTPDTDPSKAGGLASTPFDDPGDIAGTLTATIEGKPTSVAINIR